MSIAIGVRIETDVKLTSRRIWVTGACHRHNAFFVWWHFFTQLGSLKFTGNRPTRSTVSISLWISALNHKSGSIPMKRESIIEPLPNKGGKVLDCLGGGIWIEFDDYFPFVSFTDN